MNHKDQFQAAIDALGGMSQVDVAQHFNVSQASVTNGLLGECLRAGCWQFPNAMSRLCRTVRVQPAKPQPRLDYRLRVMDGSFDEKEQLVNQLKNHDFTVADLLIDAPHGADDLH